MFKLEGGELQQNYPKEKRLTKARKYEASIKLVKKAGKSAQFFVGLQDRKAFMSYKH